MRTIGLQGDREICGAAHLLHAGIERLETQHPVHNSLDGRPVQGIVSGEIGMSACPLHRCCCGPDGALALDLFYPGLELERAEQFMQRLQVFLAMDQLFDLDIEQHVALDRRQLVREP